MRRQLKSRAIILSGRDLGESDRIITFLTRDHGRLSAVAKGARRSKRRFTGALEIFSLVEVCATDLGRELLTLDSCDLTHAWPNIRADVRRYGQACYLCELARELFPEREPARDAFALLALALERLSAAEGDPPWELLAELRLLSLAGFAPRLTSCRCGAPVEAAARFYPAQGGVLCPRCAPPGAEATLASAGTLRLLGEAARLELAKLSRLRFSRQAVEESARLLTALARHTLGKELKSRKFLESLA